MAVQTGRGVQFWDVTEPANNTRLRRISKLDISGLDYGDYEGTAWQGCWTGRWLYMGLGGNGLAVIDTADIANPQLVRIVTTQSSPHLAAVRGDRMISAIADNGRVSLSDISDPSNPLLIQHRDGAVHYSIGVDADLVLTAVRSNRMDILRWTRTGFNFVRTVTVNNDSGLYVTTANGRAYLGCELSVKEITLGDLTNPQQVLPDLTLSVPSGSGDPDHGQTTVLGNLLWIGNDHGNGSGLVPLSAQTDTTPPSVTAIFPTANATGVSRSSIITVQLSETLDHRSITAAHVRLRRIGATVDTPCLIGYQWNEIHLSTTAQLPAGTYQVIIPAGGLRDVMGNAITAGFTSTFTTQGASSLPPVITAGPSGPASRTIGQSGTWTVSANDPENDPLTYTWTFSDGRAPVVTAVPQVTTSFAAPGHWTISVSVSDGTSSVGGITPVTVHRPLAGTPRASSPIALSADGSRLWAVNADGATVTAVDTAAMSRLFERPVGPNPTAAAVAADGSVWVTCRGDDTIRILDGASGNQIGSIALGYGAQPHGLAMSPNGQTAYVTAQGRSTIHAFSTTTRLQTAVQPCGPMPRALAVSADGNAVWVSRFLSADTGGEVRQFTGALTPVAVRTLAVVGGSDGPNAGRGVPNHLVALGLSPDGSRLWIPAKKDNILRGQFRDGQTLGHDSTVRAMAAIIDAATGSELASERIDFDDADSPSAIAFTPLGDYALIAFQGLNSIRLVDSYTRSSVGGITFGNGRAPQGLAVSASGTRLYVHHFLGRSLSVVDLSAPSTGSGTSLVTLAEIPLVDSEPLAATVLAGKRHFYDASDGRMSREGYLSCATCHLEGGQDGRTWDFTQRGEGLRNTTDLRGRRGTGHGPVHWTANFDEIQDFEHDIRSGFGGTGFLSAADFAATSDPLGAAKAGRSADLDALAAYVASLGSAHIPRSPHRASDGSLTPAAVQGQALFRSLSCASCHAGPDFTDSSFGLRHAVGTFGTGSGQRIGQPLDGIDTPSLLGLHASAPYFHDGSAATIADAIARSGGQHGGMASLSAADRVNLAAYLLELDGTSVNPGLPAGLPVVTVTASLPTATERGAAGAITIAVNPAPVAPLVVAIAVDGSAIAGTDYVALPSTVTIPAGVGSATLHLAAKGDAVVEPSETVRVRLAGGVGYAVGAPSAAVVNIADGPIAPTALAGDRTGDGLVNLSDLSVVTAAMGTANGQIGFDPRADATADGVIDATDLAVVAAAFGRP